MNPLFLLAPLCLLFYNPPLLTVIDMNGKTPPHISQQFSPDEYILRNFPVYTEDLPTLIDAIQKAAKLIDQQPDCYRFDTLTANHTLVVVKTDCQQGRKLTVRLVTQLDTPKFLCDFEVVRKESDKRKAQLKLLEFAAYLSQAD